jgi:hypothetical protein
MTVMDNKEYLRKQLCDSLGQYFGIQPEKLKGTTRSLRIAGVPGRGSNRALHHLVSLVEFINSVQHCDTFSI